MTVAADVGPIINLSGAENQIEGSVVDGLSTMLGQSVTFEDGVVQQSNFDRYPMLRMPHTPNVDIHFIDSDYQPTGLGEPALPPLAPAVCNARSTPRPASAFVRYRFRSKVTQYRNQTGLARRVRGR